MDTQLENLDWVKERSNCSAACVFQTLKTQIVSDISARNALLPDNSSYLFSMPESSAKAFSVMLNSVHFPIPNNNPYQAITFILEGREIIVQNCEREIFRATLTLNNDGKCRLRIKENEELTPWQMRKKALEKLFFEII